MAPIGSSLKPEAGSRGTIALLGERLVATRRAITRGLADLLGAQDAPAAERLEALEDALLQADVGVEATARIVAKIRTQPSPEGMRATLALPCSN